MAYGYGWRPYVSAAQRRARAAKKVAKLKKSGRAVRPVEIDGRKIARTFWGESWCENLEAYSDYENRLPRGRTYARNGSVIDLQIEAGRVRAMVSGSSFYNVDIKITPLAKKRWDVIKSQCAGKIDSMVELLQGAISKGVMEVVTRHGEGLFPSPKEISLSCSCPDWATMCKHVAAALYGVGARLDHEPEMLFTLRKVEPAEMIAAAVTDAPTQKRNGRGRILKTDDMSSVFGIDLDMDATANANTNDEEATAPKRRGRKKATAKKSATTAAKTKAKAPAARKKRTASRTNATATPSIRTRTTKTAAKAPSTTKASTRKKPNTKIAASTKTTKKPTAEATTAKKKTAKKVAAAKAATQTAGIGKRRVTRTATQKTAATKGKRATTKKTASKPAATKRTAKTSASRRKVAVKKPRAASRGRTT